MISEYGDIESEISLVPNYEESACQCRRYDLATSPYHFGLVSSGSYTVGDLINDNLELLTEPRWLQNWEPRYPLGFDSK